MGAYTAFLDLTLALASPLLGLIAAGPGIGSVFLTSAGVVLCAAVIAMRLLTPSMRRVGAIRGLASGKLIDILPTSLAAKAK